MRLARCESLNQRRIRMSNSGSSHSPLNTPRPRLLRKVRCWLKVILHGSLLLSCGAHAGDISDLREAVRNTILSNPEIQAAYREFLSAEQQVLVAKGGFLPRIDLEAGAGVERINDPRFASAEFDRERASIALEQMLFDGYFTRNEVRRLNHAARTRLYEVQNIAQEAAREVVRAYFDVLRNRDFVALSEENYATHRVIFDQIEQRVNAGVGRRVDLDQAAGRLALSESNLLTDVTNLHDVSRRYQRIVGETPASELEEPEFTRDALPASVDVAVEAAYDENPLMHAAIANWWSSRAALDAAKAKFMPRLDLRGRQDVWRNRDDISGRYEEGALELVMSVNVFNGGSDIADRRRLAESSLAALDVRNKTCRDLRQEVSIAYNDTKRLEEQKTYLDRHQRAIERAREAYRRQFDIGQRTLLDILDTENEYYEARRAYRDAERNHSIAYSRVLAGMGTLISTLQTADSMPAMTAPRAYEEEVADLGAACPEDVVQLPVIDKEAIFEAAKSKSGFVFPAAPAAPTEDGAAPAQPASKW